MRKIINGKEVIILSEDGHGGFTSIEVEKLTMKTKDIFSERALLEAEADMPPGFREMTLIAAIRSNMAGSDSMGWLKHKEALRGEGYVV